MDNGISKTWTCIKNGYLDNGEQFCSVGNKTILLGYKDNKAIFANELGEYHVLPDGQFHDYYILLHESKKIA